MARIRYRVRIPEPATRLVSVELEAEGVSAAARLVMPAWTPGSYLLREFARNVVHFEALDGARSPLPSRKVDKHTWQVDAPGDGVLRARWVVHAAELSVRTNHVDATHAFLTGAATFLFLQGRADEPADVTVEAPEGWQVTTALPRTPEGAWRAADFDTLVDSPFEIGRHRVLEWAVDGVPHRYAIWGRGNEDDTRLTADTTRIVRAERALFGGLPYPEFTFILHLISGATGGLEHRDSTVLATDRWSFRGKTYEQFLGLVAHELFHAWNGKRIRPAGTEPVALTREHYTRDLWVVEGFTTYYTDLILCRAGIIGPARYLEKLGEMISRFQQLPGRAVQPLADSSFDTWIKFYRPDENTPNATISYYQKGALVAMLLDLRIRGRSGNARSLDDVVRTMWERYGARETPFPEGAVEAVAAEVAGEPLDGFFDHALRSTAELDYASALAAAGLVLVPAHAPTAPRAGAPRPQDDAPVPRVRTEARTGLQLRAEGGRLFAVHVLAGGAAWRGGVNAGDELVALDGFRIPSMDWLHARVVERAAGSALTLTVFRRDELVNLRVPVEHGPPQQFAIRRMPEVTAEQEAVLEDWLRCVVPGQDSTLPARGGGGE